jgi:hypothetical protein
MGLKDNTDKKILLIAFGISVLLMISLINFFTFKKNKDEYYKITRLSDEYNKNEDGENIKIESFKSIVKDVTENNSNENVKIDVNNDKVLESIIREVETLINTNDFDKLISKFNANYVKEFNVNTELLYDKLKFSENVTAKITKYKHDDVNKDRAVVTFRLIDENNSERIFDFTIFSNGTIADLPLYKEIELKNKKLEKDNVVYEFKRKYITRLGSIYVLNIKNNSEEMVDIQDIKGTLGTSFEYDHELINGNKFTYQITPKENVDIVFKIFNQDNPDDIIITNKKMDGIIEKFGIWNNKDI